MHRLLLVVPALALGLAFHPAAAADQKKVLYFPTWSAELDDSARAVIDEAATQANGHDRRTVTVSGFASTIGSPRANQLLAELRAQVVADELMQKGVRAGRLRLNSRGSSHFVSTPLESRRVEVTISAR